MAFKRFKRVTENNDWPRATWVYLCDGEGDVAAALPKECVCCLVAEPAAGKSPLWLRKTDGSFAQVAL